MLSRTNSASIVGVDAQLVTVEADVSMGLPALTLVGQVSGALNEARERVKAALGHCGQSIPPRKQVVNLAPAELRKDSSGLDLAVAIALLAAHGFIDPSRTERAVFWAELALDGELRPVSGSLVVADMARKQGITQLFVAPGSAHEASLIPGIEVRTATSLRELVAFLRGEKELACVQKDELKVADDVDTMGVDLADVRGLTLPRLALELMVAGGHNLLLHGAPGVGKTMLARRAATLFPRLDTESALEVTKIHAVASRKVVDTLMTSVPIRMPHHTVSSAGLLGGGQPTRPGEVSLAHRGLLFLDELPEFRRPCIEGLREPLEEGAVAIVRAQGALTFPARFQLMAAMNPCPCGYFGHPERSCACPARSVSRYQQRVSGPFLDRMDLIVPITPASNAALHKQPPGESSAQVRSRIEIAVQRQRSRFMGTALKKNAEIPAQAGAMDQFCAMSPSAQKLLERVAERELLSLRAQHRLRRVARTFADLRYDTAVDAPIGDEAMAAAIQLRRPLQNC